MVNAQQNVVITGIIIFLIGFIFIIVNSMKYVNIHQNYREVETGTCRSVKSYYTNKYLTRCKCGRNCRGRFNCLIIEVNLIETEPSDQTTLAPSGENGTKVLEGPLVLYENTDALHSKTCTYHPRCSAWRKRADARVAQYNKTFGVPGATFRCYFSSNRPQDIFRVPTNTSTFVHLFLWPALAIVVGLAMLIGVMVCDPEGVRQLCSVCCPCCRDDDEDSEMTKLKEKDNTASEYSN